MYTLSFLTHQGQHKRFGCEHKMIDHPPSNPFVQTIEQLLEDDTLILYGRTDEIPTADMQAVLELLEERFEREAIGYPGPPLKWDAVAAGWSVKVIFYAAQLLLYRSHDVDDLAYYFAGLGQPKTAAAIASADICLRYLPSILRQLEAIDVEDVLIPILQGVLHEWHYTGLLAGLTPDPKNLEAILEDESLTQLYVDRVIETKNRAAAALPELSGSIVGALGNHAEVYWKELNVAS